MNLSAKISNYATWSRINVPHKCGVETFIISGYLGDGTKKGKRARRQEGRKESLKYLKIKK